MVVAAVWLFHPLVSLPCFGNAMVPASRSRGERRGLRPIGSGPPTSSPHKSGFIFLIHY